MIRVNIDAKNPDTKYLQYHTYTWGWDKPMSVVFTSGAAGQHFE